MDVQPIAMFADPDFNPDLWELRREVLKHQKKSFTSPPLPTQIFQPGTSDAAYSSEHAVRQIKRESPSDADLDFRDSPSNGVSSMLQRPRTPPKQHFDPSSRQAHLPARWELPASGKGKFDSDRVHDMHGFREAHADSWETSAPGGFADRARDFSGESKPGHLERLPFDPSDTRGSHTLIPKKRTLSDASQSHRRPSHAFQLDQDRDGGMRRGTYSEAPRDLSDRQDVFEHDSTRGYDPLGRRDHDSHGRGGHTNGRARDSSESHRRRDSDGFMVAMANGNTFRQEDSPRHTDTLDRILASPSYTRLELDDASAVPQSSAQQDTPAPEPKLSQLDIMALKAKIPRIEAERDAARTRAQRLQDDLAIARRGADREQDLEDEVMSWRTRAEDAVYRSDVLATRLRRLLAGELPEGLNPDADGACSYTLQIE